MEKGKLDSTIIVRVSDDLVKRKARAIIIWPFSDAPKMYQDLSQHTKWDPEWIGFIPEGIEPPWEHGDKPWWINELGANQTINDMETYEVDGGTVYISAPA